MEKGGLKKAEKIELRMEEVAALLIKEPEVQKLKLEIESLTLEEKRLFEYDDFDLYEFLKGFCYCSDNEAILKVRKECAVLYENILEQKAHQKELDWFKAHDATPLQLLKRYEKLPPLYRAFVRGYSGWETVQFKASRDPDVCFCEFLGVLSVGLISGNIDEEEMRSKEKAVEFVKQIYAALEQIEK